MRNDFKGDNRHSEEKGKIPKLVDQGVSPGGLAATQHTQKVILFISTVSQFARIVKYFFFI
jgi:hypothetical protein